MTAIPLSQLLEDRKKQFVEFLKTALPQDKQELITEIGSKSLLEFLAFFKLYVVPSRNNLDQVVSVMLVKTGVNVDQFSKKDLEKFKQWLEYFCDVLSNLQ